MARRNLGTLTVDLIAKVGGFVAGMDKAEREQAKRVKAIKKTFNELTDTVKKYTLAAGAAFAGFAAGTLAVVNSTRKAVDEQAKLAQSLNTSINGLKIATRAGELSGVAFDKISQATKDLTRRLSQAAEGGGPAAEALERLKLTADDLFGLPLDEKIALINQRILEFIPAAQRAAIAGKLFGEEGSLQISRLSPETIRQAREEIELFGGALSDIDASKIEIANDAISRIDIFKQGVAERLTVEFSVLFFALAEGLTDAAEKAGDLDEKITDVFASIVDGSLVAVAAVRRIVLSIQEASRSALNLFQKLQGGVNSAGENARISALTGFEVLRGRLPVSSLRESFEDSKKKLEALGYEFSDSLEQDAPLVEGFWESLVGDLDSDPWLQRQRQSFESVRQEFEQSAREMTNARQQALLDGPNVPSVPGADATMPAMDPAIVATRAVDEWLKAGDEIKTVTDQMSVYADQAARNMQSAFANFLFNPFDDGLKGMLQGFADTLSRMAAEMAASAIFDSLFKNTEGGLGGFISGIFGGQRAAGGPVMAGMVYEVGERGAELFRSGGRQYMIPAASGRVESSAPGTTQVFNITTPNPDSFRSSKRQIKRMARRDFLA